MRPIRNLNNANRRQSPFFGGAMTHWLLFDQNHARLCQKLTFVNKPFIGHFVVK
jgi:hypothetical protein